MRLIVVRCQTVLSIACVLSGSGAAQSARPERPIQLIVPFPAGGGVDASARPFAEMLGELLHQAIVVVPRDGAVTPRMKAIILRA